MPTLTIETLINASADICFDVARDMDLHPVTVSRTRERVVASVTTGLIGLGESVTFDAVHLGVRQRLTAKVTTFDRPHCFVDEMTKGAFQSFRHRHEFVPDGAQTRMRDTLIWTTPFGIAGRFVDALFLKAHLENLLRERGVKLKEAAEAYQSTF